jgi:hypothetical protein
MACGPTATRNPVYRHSNVSTVLIHEVKYSPGAHVKDMASTGAAKNFDQIYSGSTVAVSRSRKAEEPF